MAKGFIYLVAIMDWHSRRVLSWRTSNTLDSDFCVEALEEVLARYGTPEIFNTDQGRSVHLGGVHECAQGARRGRSAWTVAVAGWTTCSSNDCGAA